MANNQGDSPGAIYAVYTTSEADSQIERTPPTDRQRVLGAILDLGGKPRPYACKKLQNRNGYHIRVGDYRVLYLVEEEAMEVTVTRVAHRREVYRR